MLTKDDLLAVQEEAKRQQLVAIERLERAQTNLKRTADALSNATQRQSDAADAIALVDPLLPGWGRDVDGALVADRPVLKKDIDAKLAVAKSDLAAWDTLKDQASAESQDAEAELKAAKQNLEDINRSLQQVDAAIRTMG
jgi:hypothetical protein